VPTAHFFLIQKIRAAVLGNKKSRPTFRRLHISLFAPEKLYRAAQRAHAALIGMHMYICIIMVAHTKRVIAKALPFF